MKLIQLDTTSLKWIGELFITQVSSFSLVNIDYDAKPQDFFTQGIWGGLPDRTSSTTLRSLNHVEGKLVHHLELQTAPSRLDHQLDQQRDPTSSPCPQHESSYNLLNQWDPGEKPLFPQLFRTTISAKIIYFLWIQSEYNLSCMLSKHWELLKILQKETRLKKTHVIQINGLSTSHTQEFNHLHTNIHIYTLHFIHDIHISTRTCHIHHKRGVTEVCHFGHFWLSYGRSATSGSPMGRSKGAP